MLTRLSFERTYSDDQILRNLQAYGFEYAQALCLNYAKGNSLFKFTQLLFNFYQSYNRAPDLVQWAILQQVQSTTHAEDLFREGSTATNLSYHLFHHDQLGTKYLHAVVGPLVQQLVSHPLISKVEKADTDADQNLELLFTFLEEFLDRLRCTVSSCPIYIRDSFLYFRKGVENKFPDSKAIISSILFLRFILPAVITPQQYGIWHEKPSCQKGLILAARILQSIANFCEVDECKWSNYSKLNCFVVRMFPKMEAFINTLLNEEKIRKGKLVISASISFKPSVSEREAAVRDLMRFLEHEEERTQSLPRTVMSNRRKSPEEMQQKLMDLNFDENWKLQKTKRGINLFSLRSEDTPLAIFKVVAEIECSYTSLFSHLWNIEENMEFYKFAHPYVTDIQVIKKQSDVEIDYYSQLNLPFPISKRDMAFKSYGMLGGTVTSTYITTYSIPEKEYPSPKKGYTRIDAHVTGYIIEPMDTYKSKITCINYLDLKGNIPLWMKNLVGVNLLCTPIHIAKWCKDRSNDSCSSFRRSSLQ